MVDHAAAPAADATNDEPHASATLGSRDDDLESATTDGLLELRIHALEAENAELCALRDRAINVLKSALPVSASTSAADTTSAADASADARLLQAARQVAATLREPANTRRDLKIHDPGRKFINFCGNDDANGAREFLLASPAVLSMRHCGDMFGATVLHLAASKGATKLAALLIDEFHADPLAVDLVGRTPLHLAADGVFQATCDALAARMGDAAYGERAPVDMSGVTPSAAAALSAKKTANRSALARSLHRFGDVCVSPKPRALPQPRATAATAVPSQVRFGHYEMPGFRGAMEDASVALVSASVSLFAVMDGHGGARCAVEVQQQLRALFPSLADALADALADDAMALEAACKDVFAKLEQHLARLPELQPRRSLKTAAVGSEPAVYETTWPDSSGTTLVLALVTRTQVAVAHVGDSRAVWFNARGDSRPVTLDHRAVPWPLAMDKLACEAWCARERARVEARGATVNAHGYVVFPSGHALQMTRCLGDLYGKPDVLSAEPTVAVLPRRADEFLLLACDGVFDVLDEPAVARTLLPRVADLNDACYQLCVTAASAEGDRPGSDDNLSATLVALGPPVAATTTRTARRVLTFDG